MRAPYRHLAAFLAIAVTTAAANARPVTLSGVTFSDERGGFTIVGGTGSGTLDDPFIILEEITGPAAVVLVIRGYSSSFGNQVGTYHPTGFALRKILTNRTPFIWSFVDFELRQIPGVPSDTLDGLSFGQGANSGRPFASDRFAHATEIHEPIDYISFQDGELRPGESAAFDVIVTDTTPISPFYLIQRPNRPIARAAVAPRGRAPAW